MPFQFITNQGIQLGIIPNTTWTPSVNFVYKQTQRNRTNYQINTGVDDAEYDNFAVLLLVHSYKNSYQVLSYDYQYTNRSNDKSYQVDYIQGQPLTIQQVFGPASQASQNAENYKQVGLTSFHKDQQGQTALAYAVQFITNQGEFIGLLSNSSAWSLESVNSVSEQMVQGTNYQITTVINSADDDVFIASLVVNSFKNAYQVLSYEYEATNDINNNIYQVNYTLGQPLLVQGSP